MVPGADSAGDLVKRRADSAGDLVKRGADSAGDLVKRGANSIVEMGSNFFYKEKMLSLQ